MASKQKSVEDTSLLQELMRRMERLETRVEELARRVEVGPATEPTAPFAARGEAEELPVPPWRHLVARRHPWRRQLYLKGRNMTVRQLVGTIKANRLSPEEGAENLELPVEAITEALEYAARNQDLLAAEVEIERSLLAQRGYKLGPPTLPG
jgi:uncharacterized protein (DUF433 family)